MLEKRYSRMLFFILDVLIVFLSFIAASNLLINVAGPDIKIFEGIIFPHGVIIALFYFIGFLFFKVYSSLWQEAGYYDYIHVVYANLTGLFLTFIYGIFLSNGDIGASLVIVAGGFILMSTLASRMYLRVHKRTRTSKKLNRTAKNPLNKVLIIGAGQAAAIIIREINNHQELNIEIVGLVDDALFKVKSRISGYKVLGTIDDIYRLVEKYQVDEIILAMPSATHEEKKRALSIAKSTKAKLKTLPGLYEIVSKGVNVHSIRDVEISDLLGRSEIHLDNALIANYIADKVVLITGGGGSIGSELSRQVAMLNPRQLIIVDIYENNAYTIENELRRNYPTLNLLVLIASVRDERKIRQIFERHKPHTVFHAAAHKHVPLMETSPEEAVKNNVFGTYHVAKAAGDFETERFILISTDKAVNPTNIMGATKRLCEMIIQTLNEHTDATEYVAVRFGNVLGSNGSVIPVFKEQIKYGGPVTLTHKDIVRYFMTIPEAVQLVLQAGAYAKGGEVFVLDMGEPVRIYDLAENLIRLSGLKPHEDIEIKITGLRPGEKLYEELLMAEEGLESTPNHLIFVGRPKSYDKAELTRILQELKSLVYNDFVEGNQVKRFMENIVPTYQPETPEEKKGEYHGDIT